MFCFCLIWNLTSRHDNDDFAVYPIKFTSTVTWLVDLLFSIQSRNLIGLYKMTLQNDLFLNFNNFNRFFVNFSLKDFSIRSLQYWIA